MTAARRPQRPDAAPGGCSRAPGTRPAASTSPPSARCPPGSTSRARCESAGLAGRGGAGFPSARKLRSVAARGRGRAWSATRAEGEPARGEDRRLLLAAPHLVLDGLVLAAAGRPRPRGIPRPPRGPTSAGHLREQVALRRERCGIAGRAGRDRSWPARSRRWSAPLDGRPGAAPDGSVRVYERRGARPPDAGPQRRDARARGPARPVGPAWFRSVGTADEPGTFLATVSGAVPVPGCSRSPFGVRRSADLVRAAGAASADAQAVLVGGYHGAWVPAGAGRAARMSRTSLATHGASVGAGVVAVLGRDRCGLVESAPVAGYLGGPGRPGSAGHASTGCRGWPTR